MYLPIIDGYTKKVTLSWVLSKEDSDAKPDGKLNRKELSTEKDSEMVPTIFYPSSFPIPRMNT